MAFELHLHFPDTNNPEQIAPVPGIHPEILLFNLNPQMLKLSQQNLVPSPTRILVWSMTMGILRLFLKSSGDIPQMLL